MLLLPLCTCSFRGQTQTDRQTDRQAVGLEVVKEEEQEEEEEEEEEDKKFTTSLKYKT